MRTPRWFLVASGLTILAMLLASCAPQAAPPAGKDGKQAGPAATPKPSGAPKTGGTLRFGSYIRQVPYDPHTTATVSVYWDMATNLLLGQDVNTGELKPELAEKWERPDDLTYTFRLRQGVKFQDVDPVKGREVTAEDVVYSYQRIRSPGPMFVRRGLFDPVKSIEAVDKYTVKFTLKESFAPFLRYVGDQYNKIIAPEMIQKFTDLNVKESTMGTGPYLFKEDREGVGGRMTRNPNYWEKGVPYADEIEFLIMEDDTTRGAAMRTGKIDIGIRIAVADYLASKDDPKIKWADEPTPFVVVLMMNHKRKPLDDVRVRKALYLAMDRQEMIKLAYDGYATLAGGFPRSAGADWATFTPEELLKMPGYRQPKDQDIAEAKKLLAEALPQGWEVTIPITKWAAFINYRPLEIVASQLAKVGIKANLKEQEQNAYQTTERTGDFSLLMRALYQTPIEPDSQFYPLFHSKGTRNQVGLSDPKIDEMVEKGRKTLDQAARAKIYRDLQNYIMNEQYYRIFWAQVLYRTGTGANVRGYNGAFPLDNRQLRYTWLDK